MLEGHDGYGLLEIDAEKLWAFGNRITYEPKYGKGHVGVWGFSRHDPQPRQDAAYASRVIVPPRIPEPN